MKKISLILSFIFFSLSVFASDEKLGRFFEDQPDVNDDFQIHVIYTLYADSKDNENDINEKIEKYIQGADDWIYKKTKQANKQTNTMNSEGQRLKWDYRKDGKLDISFFRFAYGEKKKNSKIYGTCPD